MAKDLVKFFFMIFLLIGVVGIFLFKTIQNVDKRNAEVEAYCKDFAQKQLEAQQETEGGSTENSTGIVYETGDYDTIYQECMQKNKSTTPMLITP